MPWTNPIPTQPNKQWLYVNNTTSILGNTANEDSLICWAYAQGYTGVLLYQLNTLTGGGITFTPANSALLSAFINKCNSNGIAVGGAFGGPNVIQAIISQGGFAAAVSEIEWWNYSYNLPYQKQDATGTYSFYDALQMFMTYKSQLNTANIELITYNGFTKGIDYEYQYKYPVVQEYINPVTGGQDTLGREGFAINGNFTSDNTAPIIESNVFYYGDVIKVNNFPSPTLQSYVKLSGVQPTELVSGTTLFTASGAEVSDGRVIFGNYKPDVQILSYFISGGVVNLNVAPGHGVLPVTRLVVNSINFPEFALSFRAPSSNLDIQSVAGNVLTGYSNFNISNISSYSATAGVVTLTFPPLSAAYTFYNPTATAALLFQLGDSIVVTGLGAGFDGTFTVTNVTANSIQYSAAVSNTPSTATTGSTVNTQTRALQTYGSPVTAVIRMFTIGPVPTVSNLHEIVYIGPSRFFSPYAGEIALRGDKTYHFANNRVSKIAVENYNIASPSNIFTVAGTAIYNAGLQQTRVFLTVDPNTYLGSGPEYTTFLAMANLDVVYESNSGYGLPGTELQQLVPHVDSYALTVYEQNIPNYSYIKSRVTEIAQGINTISGSYTPKVYYLFGAYSQASLNFYKGLNALGNNAASSWPKKGAKEAYDYVSFTLSPSTPTINSPSQTGSPISAEAETDVDVQAWIQIEGLLMFKYTDFANQSIKNGPKVLVTAPIYPNNLINVTATPPVGSVNLPALTFCDDCLPASKAITRSTSAGVSTIITESPHGLSTGAQVQLQNIGGTGYDGFKTITVTATNAFTFTTIGPNEISTSCPSNAKIVIPIQISWSIVVDPSVGSSTLSVPLDIYYGICNITSPNTLNFTVAGTYVINAVISNPITGTLSSQDSNVAKTIEYTVVVTTSTPNPLTIEVNQDVTPVLNTCTNGTSATLPISVTSGNPNYIYKLYLNTISPANLIATSISTSSNFYNFTGLANAYNGNFYIVVVTDSANQTATITNIEIVPDLCEISTSVTNVSCAGGSDGVINLDFNITDPLCNCGFLTIPYSSEWFKNGVYIPAYDDTLNQSGLTAGSYTINITTCTGCVQTYIFEVIDGNTIELDTIITSNSTCGQLNGSITATLTGICSGLGTLHWVGGTTGSPASHVITNAIGTGTEVTYTTSVPHNFFLGQLVYIAGMTPSGYDTLINYYPSAVITALPTSNSFKIASTETAAFVSGGQVFTDFVYSPNVSNSYNPATNTLVTTLYNISGGSYYLTGFDSCVCYYTSPTISLGGGFPPTATITPPLGGYVICNSGSVNITGTITSDCAYTTSWTNIASGATYSGGLPLTVTYPPLPGQVVLDKGYNTLQLQVTDCNGCTVTVNTSVLVTAPLKPVTGIVYTGGPLTVCPGTTVPYVLTVQGGVIPSPGQGYWSLNGVPDYGLQDYPTLTVDNSYFISNNSITFTYTQTDINGCVSSADVTIDPPLPVTLQIAVKNNPCGGPGNLGEIDLVVINGCPPYTYSWTGPGGFTALTQDITGLINGTYQVTVEDDAGNIVVSNPIIVDTAVPYLDNIVIVNTCNNNPNGSISFDIVDGTAPFTITWQDVNNGTTTITVTSLTTLEFLNLKNGTYIFNLVDDYGCEITETFVIQNAPPIVLDPIVWDSSCFSACDGLVDFTGSAITGGAGGPYELYIPDPNNNTNWIPAPSLVLSALCRGVYFFKVIDSNGCFATIRVVINSTPPIDFTESITYPNFETGTLGSIQITSVTNGGGPPYTYVWTDENGNIIGTDPLLSNLSDGTYTVTITGYPGCYASRTYILLGRCNAFSYPEFRLQLYKFQCCAGQLAKKYVNLVNIGRMDLAKCLEMDLKYLTVTLDTLTCIESLPDPCLSCDDLNNIFNQLKKICDCDCCESDENAYTVRYDSETKTFIPIIPEVSGGGTNTPPQP